MHSAVVPLSGVRGQGAEVTVVLLDALTAGHIQPLWLAVTAEIIQEESREVSLNWNCVLPACLPFQLCVHFCIQPD